MDGNVRRRWLAAKEMLQRLWQAPLNTRRARMPRSYPIGGPEPPDSYPRQIPSLVLVRHRVFVRRTTAPRKLHQRD